MRQLGSKGFFGLRHFLGLLGQTEHGSRADEFRDDGVRLLDGGYLSVEVAVFSGLVGRLEVEEAAGA